MVKYKFKFKSRGSGFRNIEVEDDGSITVPVVSFKNPSEACRNIVNIVQTMLKENWTAVDIKEL